MNKLAVVTGAASGLGLQFSHLLAKDSFDLILNDIDGRKLQEASVELQKIYNTSIRMIVKDLGENGAARRFYEEMGPLTPDVLINNAGFGLKGEFISTSWKLEESMIYLHIITPTLLTKLILFDMTKKGSGKIMNVSSVGAFVPGPLMAIYYASKSYLFSFGSAISRELRDSAVSVTTVCPGLMCTDFAKKMAEKSNTSYVDKGFFYDNSETIGRIAYKAMQEGKSFCIPGVKSKFMRSLLWLLPRSVSVNLLNKVQQMHCR
jgi:short-subunit dehydrogenase